MTYTVYVLFSEEHQKIYIGYTSNLIQRFKSHQLLGKDWTARFRPWIVIYCEYFTDKSDAQKRDKNIGFYITTLANITYIYKIIHNYLSFYPWFICIIFTQK